MDPGLDLAQLRSFFTLARAGSFSEAARRLNRTQSAVSHAIRKLEDSVGLPLVDRRSREFRLSEEGRRLFQACESVFSTLDAAEEDLGRGRALSKGRLRLGATIEFGSSILMKHIRPFLAAHPGIEMDFTLAHELLGPLLKDEIDLAIDCVDHNLPELQKTPLFREIYVVACAPGLQEERRLRVPADLERCAVLSLDKAGTWWHRFLLALPERKRPDFQRVIAVNHIRGMINASIEGLGVLLAPKYSVLEELARGVLVPLFPSIRPVEDRFHLYQKTLKAGLEKHRRLTEYLLTIHPSEFGS
jgi:DNA-binding transcriptional LysR family regulator